MPLSLCRQVPLSVRCYFLAALLPKAYPIARPRLPGTMMAINPAAMNQGNGRRPADRIRLCRLVRGFRIELLAVIHKLLVAISASKRGRPFRASLSFFFTLSTLHSYSAGTLTLVLGFFGV